MKVSRSRRSPGLCSVTWRKLLVALVVGGGVFLHVAFFGDGSSLMVLSQDEKIYFVAPQATGINTTVGAASKRVEKESTDRRVIWSRARTDRSGATIQDMLMCHAYAFHNGFTYGGACARNMPMQVFNSHKPNHEKLLDAVGLSKVLRFKCPDDHTTPLQNRDDYIKNDTGIFTADYLEYLQSIIVFPPKPTRPLISVHMRRGDISPCRPRTRGYPRYLPNQHFLRLIERYNPKNLSDVVVYSESESFESFDAFSDLGYHVVLDGSIGDVWRGIVISDVVILSRSSFSLVPAIMTRGKVVFTPFWHEPLPHWDVVEEEFMNETLTEFRRLKATCPNKKDTN